ncbi:ATP-dependent DNA helicase RecQ [Planctomycetes bacterium Pla163]|uniref:ATP-dependent DNA helicase RecQ n=1 Tax=Rohdeia mirabilis TaxID=2528008 RepID=A0A518CXC0_9BACT|nr:ATP-dependent DNA helicase RecQ [Planctomycetes bacterium Pla163]
MDRTLELLRSRFGHTELRGLQAPAIEAVLAGRDTVLTIPTGGGKSLCYQLPALVLEGTTLVVSPLIALMQDQVDALRAKGVAATFVNSSLDAPTRAQRLAEAREGAYDLLYVTPERFRSRAFLAALPELNITRLAVDEAHCISEWGHDFRPDYHRLGHYRELLGDPPCIAVTATATPRVVEDVCAALRLDDPLVLRGGIERPNLFMGLSVAESPEERIDLIASRLSEIGGAGIVYSTLIRDLERLHDELVRRGVPSLVYHGKLSQRERRQMQARFMDSTDEVVLATAAFGMGVDKPDIRFVLHAQLPRTVEAWTQEIGRAGRDGEPSWCEAIAHPEDLAVQQEFVRWANPDREFVMQVQRTLSDWGERIATKDEQDLRGELLLKNRRDNRIGITLRWLEVLGATRGSFERGDLELLRELEDDELPASVGTEAKLQRDLSHLLEMWRLASPEDPTETDCRRVELARHFALAEPTSPCGACDRCTSAETWRAEHLARRAAASARPRASERPQPVPAAPSEAAASSRLAGTFARGDWVRIGRHLGRVVRVEGTDARPILVVESVDDLQQRRIDPRRRPVERLER